MQACKYRRISMLSKSQTLLHGVVQGSLQLTWPSFHQHTTSSASPLPPHGQGCRLNRNTSMPQE
eukprot:12401735-Karenia_brevis.AAC.1